MKNFTLKTKLTPLAIALQCALAVPAFAQTAEIVWTPGSVALSDVSSFGLGTSTAAAAPGGVAIGSSLAGAGTVAGVDSVAIGMGAVAGSITPPLGQEQGAVAIGANALAVADSVALGSGVTALLPGQVAIGSRALVGTGGMSIQGNVVFGGSQAGSPGLDPIPTTVDFTNATVLGLSTFDPTKAGALSNVTTLSGVDNTYSVDLSNGASTLGAVNAESLKTKGNVSIGGTLGVTGATTLDGNTTITGLTNINTTGAAATNLGNSNIDSTVTLSGGKSVVSVSDEAVRVTSGKSGVAVSGNGASLYSGVGDSVTGFATSNQALVVGGQGVPALSNGNAASQALVSGALVNNIIKGNTLVDGNMYINGTLVYSSNTSASTTVTGNTGTVGSMNIVNAGQAGAVVDGNGKITSGEATQATAALTVTNAQGNTHGVVVQENNTTISGGVNSTSLSLNDNGARFSNSATGAPVTVTGVANGSSDFDAVNVRQFAGAVASASAMANIPGVDTNKDASVGVGMGNFMGRSALAFGGSYRFSSNGVVKASVASGLSSGGSKATVGVGAGWSW